MRAGLFFYALKLLFLTVQISKTGKLNEHQTLYFYAKIFAVLNIYS